MNDKFIEELEAAKRDLLNAQRKCAWCDKVFDTVNQLAIHVVEVGHTKLPPTTSFEEFKKYCEDQDKKQ